MADWSSEFIKTLKGMSGRYSSYQIFSDWVESAAISYRNSCHLIHDAEWQRWEDQYMRIVARYEHDELCKFGYLIACTAKALEDEMEDFLGKVFMLAGLGDSGTGQFFTPFNISMMSAKLLLDEKGIPKEGKIRLLEHEAARWLPVNDLRQVNWLPADEMVVETIEKGGMPELTGRGVS